MLPVSSPPAAALGGAASGAPTAQRDGDDAVTHRATRRLALVSELRPPDSWAIAVMAALLDARGGEDGFDATVWADAQKQELSTPDKRRAAQKASRN